jgi:hypothetical protein
MAAVRSEAAQSSARTRERPSLRDRIDEAIELTERRYLSTSRHTPWDIVHGIKAFGQALQLQDRVNAREDRFINAIDFLCQEARIGGRRIFEPTRYGVRVIQGSGMEGHPNQFLSALAQAGLPLDHPIDIDGQIYAIDDLVEQAKYDYHPGQEASWTLIALSTYVPLDATWSNRHGEVFAIDDLVAQEASVDPRQAACGGTHNLYALAYALNRYETEGATPTRVWRQAADKLAHYHRLTMSLQNPDGLCSTEYYLGRGHSNDPVTQMGTTGHTLEWLTLYITDDELQDAWFTRAVEALLDTFERTSTQPVDCGAVYHAARALVQYQERAFSASPSIATRSVPAPLRSRY